MTLPAFGGPVPPTTLADARGDVLAGRDAGTTCPCCGQLVKVYRRKLNSPMARFLIWLVLEVERRGAPVPVGEFPMIQNRRGGGDFAKLRYWGLIREVPNDDDTKRTSGIWEPLPAGHRFVHRQIQVSERALVYDGQVIGLEGPGIYIEQALTLAFDYAELMGRRR